MKQRISIFISLLAVCLLLSTLMACAPATPPIDDTPVPTPDTTEPDIDTPIDSSVPEQNVTPTPDQPDEPDAPDEPITPIEPIEDFQLPQCIEDQLYFYSMEELSNYIDSANHISQDSETYALLAAMELNNVATYYVIDSTKVPEGYEFIYAVLDSNFVEYIYSSTPEAYEEYPWLWPEETTLHYYIYPEVYELNGRIRINGEIADGYDIVIKHTVGTNDHVTE